MPSDQEKKPRGRDDIIDWFTVSYRTLYLLVGALLIVGGGAAYYYYYLPQGPVQTAAPVTERRATSARFTSLGGSVKVKPVGVLDWRDANPDLALHKGDLVRTGRDSAAEITFFDGTIVHVRPDSLITIEETSENPRTKERRVVWHISSGEVNFQTGRRNVPTSSSEVTTPTARMKHGDLAAGDIRVATSGGSDVRLFRGSSELETTTGQRVELASNEGVRVSAGGAAGEKVVLPPVPVLVSPAHESEVVYPDPEASTTLLLWKAVPGVQDYRIMVDYSPQFNRPLVDQVRPATSVELRGLDVGKYFWKVAAIDRNDVEGPFSEFSRFSVAKSSRAAAAAPPPLEIQAFDVRTNILQVKGKTAGGATVTVNGQRLEVRSDGTFNEFITLDEMGPQDVKIRVVGINGGVREETRSVVVAF